MNGYQNLLDKADNNDALAQYQLGLIFLNGYEVEQDVEKAVEYFKFSGENGCGHAWFQLGRLCALGIIPNDESGELHVKYYGRGLDYDSGCCSFVWAQMYKQRNPEDESGFVKRLLIAYKNLICDYKTDYSFSSHYFLSLTYLYCLDFGIEHEKVAEHFSLDTYLTAEMAINCLETAIENGYGADAYNDLGIYYLQGIGVKQDLEKARELFKKAFDMGLDSAKVNLEDTEKLISQSNTTSSAETSSVITKNEKNTRETVATTNSSKGLEGEYVAPKKYSKAFFVTANILLCIFALARIAFDVYAYLTPHNFYYYGENFITRTPNGVLLGISRYYLIILFSLFLLYKGNKESEKAKKTLKWFLIIGSIELIYPFALIWLLSPDFTQATAFACSLLGIGGVVIGAYFLGLRFKREWWMYLAMILLPVTIALAWLAVGIVIVFSLLGTALSGDVPSSSSSSSSYDPIENMLRKVGDFVLYYNGSDWCIRDYYGNSYIAEYQMTEDRYTQLFLVGDYKFILNSPTHYENMVYSISPVDNIQSFNGL